jgi:hypothetical protein
MTVKQKALQCVLALAITAGAAPRAIADTHDIASAGAWTAYQGTDDQNTEICGIDTGGNNPNDDQIDIKYYNGDDELTVQLFSSGWTITDGPSNTHVDVVFDNNTPWHVDQVTGMHTGDGTPGMEFTIGKADVADFLTEFAESDQVAINFTNSNINNWTGDLSGTEQVTAAFVNCIRDLPPGDTKSE